MAIIWGKFADCTDYSGRIVFSDTSIFCVLSSVLKSIYTANVLSFFKTGFRDGIASPSVSFACSSWYEKRLFSVSSVRFDRNLEKIDAIDFFGFTSITENTDCLCVVEIAVHRRSGVRKRLL